MAWTCLSQRAALRFARWLRQMEVNAANQVGLQKPFLSNRLAPFYSATLVSISPPFTLVNSGVIGSHSGCASASRRAFCAIRSLSATWAMWLQLLRYWPWQRCPVWPGWANAAPAYERGGFGFITYSKSVAFFGFCGGLAGGQFAMWRRLSAPHNAWQPSRLLCGPPRRRRIPS